MYCKKCHKTINKNTITCPYCGFNNSNDFEMGQTLELDLTEINKVPPMTREEKIHHKKIIIATAILLIGAVIVVQLLLFSNKGDPKEITTTTTTTTTKEIIVDKEYKIDNLYFYYKDEDFLLEENKLIYKENNNYNISFSIIDNDTYDEIYNNNDMLETSLNETECVTYASIDDKLYGYLLDINNKKYHILVNYEDMEHEEILASINATLKSLIIKQEV